MEKNDKKDVCPKCGSPLGEVTTTKTGKTLRRCSTGSWNPDTRQNEGCEYVQWITPEPETLEEKCPKCENPLVLATTRFGKKLKRCSTNKWDPKTKSSTGCDFVEWMEPAVEELDEECPQCGNMLVIQTTKTGKKIKKCSTGKWNPKTREVEGCDFSEWLN